MPEPFDPSFVESVIEHMNHDHADAIVNSALAFVPELQEVNADDVQQARLTAVDALAIGVEIKSKSMQQEHLVTHHFTIPYTAAGLPAVLDGPEQVRSALVTMAKKARQLIAKGR